MTSETTKEEAGSTGEKPDYQAIMLKAADKMTSEEVQQADAVINEISKSGGGKKEAFIKFSMNTEQSEFFYTYVEAGVAKECPEALGN
jgi:hypothetical protein